jgi:hypothetical protein
VKKGPISSEDKIIYWSWSATFWTDGFCRLVGTGAVTGTATPELTVRDVVVERIVGLEPFTVFQEALQFRL